MGSFLISMYAILKACIFSYLFLDFSGKLSEKSKWIDPTVMTVQVVAFFALTGSRHSCSADSSFFARTKKVVLSLILKSPLFVLNFPIYSVLNTHQPCILHTIMALK
jgi:hypothetical protein